MSKALVAVVVLALGVVVAGCGGAPTETGADTARATITKADFIAQADRICAAGNEKIGEAAGMNATERGQEEFTLDTFLPAIQGEIDGVRALPVPAGDGEEITAFLDSAQNGLSEIQQDPSLSMDPETNPLNDAGRLAKEYGFKVCGQV